MVAAVVLPDERRAARAGEVALISVAETGNRSTPDSLDVANSVGGATG